MVNRKYGFIRLSSKNTRTRQNGVAIVVALILLVAMTLAGLAVFRSVDTAALLSANIAFKRDAAARAGVGLSHVLMMLDNSHRADFLKNWEDYCLSSASVDEEQGACKDGNTQNYVPVMLQTNSQGIPIILAEADWNNGSESDSDFDSVFKNLVVDSVARVRIRYVVERMCTEIGASSEASCVLAGSYATGGTTDNGYGTGKPGSVSVPLLRATIRVDGPRGVVSYAQAFVSIQGEN